MSSRSAEGFLEWKIRDEQKTAQRPFNNRAQFQRQWLIFRRAPQIIQFDIAAELERPKVGRRNSEMAFSAASRVFIVAIAELGSGKILANLNVRRQAICAFQRFMDLIGSKLCVGFGAGRTYYAIRMKFHT